MTDLVPALIRTYVPIGVAVLVTWLASVGVIVPDEVSATLASAIGGLAGAIYYAAVRWAEARWPKVGVMLGSTKTPTYEA